MTKSKITIEFRNSAPPKTFIVYEWARYTIINPTTLMIPYGQNLEGKEPKDIYGCEEGFVLLPLDTISRMKVERLEG